MNRSKEKPKLIHQATTLEYLYCLGDMPKWSQILRDQNNGKLYNNFLKWILKQDFFTSDEKISIKKISELSGYPSAKISKWLREIYESIFELNELQSQLFSFSGNVTVEFYIKYFDSYCSIKTSLPTVPRLYESFDFFFVKAKMGISSFWVKDVQHIIGNNGTSVLINLQGGLVNVYREFALSKALFEGSINFMDIYQKYDFEIDQQLLERR
jgi:hypothetical protein